MKVTRLDLPETIDKITATFESYWNSNEFEYYSEGQKERLARALKAEKYFDANNTEVYTMDIAPYSLSTGNSGQAGGGAHCPRLYPQPSGGCHRYR